jgi:hypothetical protein
MSTDRLIDSLAAELAPVRRRRPWRDIGILALVGAVEVALYLALGQLRPDIHLAMTLASFWWKLASLAILTAIGVATAIRSFDPAASPRPGLRRFGWAAVAALAVGWVIDAANSAGPSLAARLMWHHGLDCVEAMVALSIPPLIALALLMRRAAPTDRRGSALAVGVASASWGALVFVLNCPHDDPFYVAVWYPVGCGLVALVARVLLPRISRW